MIAQLTSFLLASMVLTIAPGPDIIFVLSQSMVGGFKRGFIIALGLVSGVIFHTTLLAFGVSALLHIYPDVLWALQLIGAAYLIYLAYQVYKTPSNLHIEPTSKLKQHLYTKGLLMNIINPKVSFFFLAFFPSFLWDNDQNVIAQFYSLGLVFMFQALLIFSLVAFFSSRLSYFIKGHKRIGFYLKYFQILSFLVIALLILI